MYGCLLIASALLFTAVQVSPCSMPVGWRPLTTEELVQRAEEVLFGRVRRTFPDDSGRPWSQNLYTAEVEVYCIMKGRGTPPLLNITDVGFVPGMCISTTLLPTESSVILASVFENVYRARRTIRANWQEAYHIAEICGLQKVYPFGIDEESASWICPTPSPPGECRGTGDSEEIPPFY